MTADNPGCAEYPAVDPITRGLEVYIVGGAVRDALLDQPCGDRDWVVVGASPEAMVARGFIPVGGDFPVFLHPHSKEEYALARTERKTGRGYKGFTFYTGPDVTLEADLQRRDLTLNAIARTRDGRLIDPLNGQADIRAKILRHTGAAFAEDPVRLLRLARFAARFHDFAIAPQTLALARALVQAGEVDALVPERIWQELSKGLMTAHPERMLHVLAETTALAHVLPGLRVTAQVTAALRCAVSRSLDLPQRFALLCLDTPAPAALAQTLKAPKTCTEHARLLPILLPALRTEAGQTEALALARTMLDVIERSDGLRRPARFISLLQAAACVVPIDLPRWQHCLHAVSSLDHGKIIQPLLAQQADGPRSAATAIKTALHQARLTALCTLLA